MAETRYCSPTLAEIGEQLRLEEDNGEQESDISIGDNDDDPDYVFDHQIEEEDEEREAEYFGVSPPPPYTPPSQDPEPSHASTSFSHSSTNDWLYAPSTRKKRREARSSCGRQQSSVVQIGDDESVDLDNTSTRLRGNDEARRTRASPSRPSFLCKRHKTPLVRGRGRVAATPDTTRPAVRWDWIDGADFEPQVFNFDESNSGIKVQTFTADSQECEFYNYFWDDNILEIIVTETNRYVYFMRGGKVLSPHSREHQWYDVTVPEIKVFLALVMLMGIVKKNNYRDYWSTDPVNQTPVFCKVMSVNRFTNILRALHFSDNLEAYANNITEKMRKIRSVFDHLRSKFKEAFYPYKNLNIDESLMLWRGNIGFRQYIPSKRHRFGLKLFVLCDCKTGFVQDIVLYTGAGTEVSDDKSLGLSGAVVTTLM